MDEACEAALAVYANISATNTNFAKIYADYAKFMDALLEPQVVHFNR